MGDVLRFGRYKGRPRKVDVSTTKLVAQAVFSGDSIKLDVDRAADELRKAGYEVFRFPKETHGHTLAHPLDDFIEARIAGIDVHAVMNEVEDIVHKYGGTCHECGWLEPGEAPFADLLPFC